jgi:hypothetical protein
LKAALKDVENVFTQHRPPVLDVLTSLKTTPKNPAYPFASTDATPARYSSAYHFILNSSTPCILGVCVVVGI